MYIHERCTGCERCLPYCPVQAISIIPAMNRYGKKAVIDLDRCVECGECQKSGVCPVDAHLRQELEWPRVLRYYWSDPLAVFPWTGIGGRGTQEMKTNDISGRFTKNDVGFGVEVGRPGVGSKLRDVEKISVKLARLGVTFEEESPWTVITDPVSGKLRDSEAGEERVLSCIIEFKAPKEKTPEIWDALMDVAEEIDSVFTVDIISVMDNREPVVRPYLEERGIEVRINGKTNVGLGRPLAE